METIIPIVIALVVFAFQAYANFQKEQEKAKKRDLGQAPPLPPLPEDNARRPVPAPVRRAEIPEPDRRQVETTHRPLFDAYTGVVEEVKHVRKANRRPLSGQRLAVNEEVSSQALLDVPEFDLRDAIIKSAILERPYQ